MNELIKKMLAGDKRSCARIISIVENDEIEGKKILKELHAYTGKAHIIGITGPPGAGKSTLTDKLAKYFLAKGSKVGIIAIDPTSPYSGGSILGDRIRMQDLALDPNVFIRSMGTRGCLGGLSKSTKDAIKVLDAYGADYIFIETVGVGQSEVDIVKTADSVIMVMVPGLGDDIQSIKAGIMEIGDIFAVNKSDLFGAERTYAEINMMLDLNQNMDRRPPVVMVTASKNIGIEDLASEIESHVDYLCKTGELRARRCNNIRTELVDMAEAELRKMIIKKTGNENVLNEYASDIYDKKTDLFDVLDNLLEIIGK